jgi:hypothetical protein
MGFPIELIVEVDLEHNVSEHFSENLKEAVDFLVKEG